MLNECISSCHVWMEVFRSCRSTVGSVFAGINAGPQCRDEKRNDACDELLRRQMSGCGMYAD